MIRLKDHRPGTEGEGLLKMYPTPEMIREAAVTLRGVARQIPVLPFGRQGGTLFLKAENLQETGSFKIRGAYNKLSSLTAEEASRGVIACSVGNQAAGGRCGGHARRCLAVQPDRHRPEDDGGGFRRQHGHQRAGAGRHEGGVI